MAVLPIGIGSAAGAGGFNVERSLRFNSADSAHLNRTLGTSNRRTFTFSAWLKRSVFASTQCIFGNINYAGGGSTNQQFYLGFTGSDQLDMFHYNNGTQNQVTSSAVYRDPSAWYHIVGAVDTTQATSSNRLKIYVNGSQITALATATYPAQNTDTFINANLSTGIGRQVGTGISGSYYNDGYLTEIYFIDGQALTPSDFGETDSATGVWKPKAFSGTYGTNGFYLKFADNSGTTSTTLGKDSSGNGNNWTPNNFSVTAGAGNDSLVDTPTSYGTDTGAGGEVRGNYCTWNALSTGRTLSNGNLDYAGSATGVAKGTLGVSSGKWYWEILANGANASAGVASVSLNPTVSYCGSTADSWCLFTSGDRYNNGSATSGYSTFTTNDIISIALDMDNGKVYWAKNGVWQGSSNPATGTNAGYTNLSGYTITPANGNNNTNDLGTANFGQRAFAYTAPSGFKALCTQNLPTPTIGATSTTQANDYFNTILYTGTGSSNAQTGVGFQPDLVWIKGRSGATDHGLYDAVRGVQKQLESNTNVTAETTETTGLTAFGSDGFTVGALAQLNTSSATYVAWNWKANGAGSSNTAGTITSTVSANTTSGFSIVTYTGTGANATVGHGLGVAPSMIIVKDRSAATNWIVGHTSIAWTNRLQLNTTGASTAASTTWNDIAPTSTVFSIGTSTQTNANTNNHVAYCFAPVAGYSAFGSYTGNGSADGPFVFTNFRPRYVLVKRTDAAGYDWFIWDSSRDTYNAVAKDLYANVSNAEETNNRGPDFLSNGFKLRAVSTYFNASGGTYIYAAFAEHPFKYSLAR